MSNMEANIHPYKRRSKAKTPSFSSILLDAIYRSIDEDTDGDASTSVAATPTTGTHNYDFYYNNNNVPEETRLKRSHNYDYYDSNNYSARTNLKQRRSRMRSDSTFETLDLRQAIMIESWMERREPQPPPHPHHYDCRNNVVIEDEKIRIVRLKSVPTKSTAGNTPSSSSSSSSRNFSKIRDNLAENCFAPAPKCESYSSSRIFTKTKTRAMKIYDDLKTKPRSPPHHPPLSPGARIAAFLNSLFRNSADRKPPPPPPATSKPNPPHPPTTSTCSSASSYSRSCLSSKTSSSSQRKTNSNSSTTTKSVRFYLDSIQDEAAESSKKVLENPRKWRREKEIDSLMKIVKRKCREQVVLIGGGGGGSSRSIENGGNIDEEMDDGDESCASSDLFELENLSSIGVSRYAEELPVYGTTSLHKLKP